MTNQDTTNGSGLGSNPITNDLNISVSIPECIDIKMVNADALNDYELWTFISSFLSNIAVGLWIWFGQNTDPKLNPFIKVVAIIASLLFATSVIIMIIKRTKLKSKTKTINIK